MRKNLDKLRKLTVPALLLFTLFISGFTKSNEQGFRITPCVVENDSVNFEFFQVTNNDGLPVFYYQDVDQYPCEDTVCARMVLRLYWDLWGNFLKIGLENGQELTKIGHKSFSDKDYERLHKLLIDPECNLQYYQLDDLTDKESEKVYYNVDAISSATIQDVSFSSVKGAVKTCYTLWKIVHGGIQDQIKSKTAEIIERQANNQELQKISRLIESRKILNKDTLAVVAKNIETLDAVHLMSLLELNRQIPDVSKDFIEKLSSCIQNNQTTSEIAIYNFLLQEDFNKKEVRKYEPSRDYF